MQYEKHNRGPW